MAPNSDSTFNFLPRGGDLLYAQELKSFLSSFSGRTPAEVWDTVQADWREHGLSHPKNLTKRLLIASLEPEANESLRALKRDAIDELIDASYEPEGLTRQFDSKPKARLDIAIAHAYAQSEIGQQRFRERGEEVTLISGDYSNMGGTNKLFEEMRRDMPGDEKTKLQAARDGTDMAARIIANLVFDGVESVPRISSLPHETIAMRSGGDELSLITAGTPTRVVETTIEEAIHLSVQRFTAKSGLQDHDHLTPNRPPGFGIALSATSLSTDLSAEEILTQSDKAVGTSKDMLELARQGRLPKEFLEKEAAWIINSMMPANHPDKSWLADNAMHHLQDKVTETATDYQELKPLLPGLNAVQSVFQSREYLPYAEPGVRVSTPLDAIDVPRKPFEDPAERLARKLAAYLVIKKIIRPSAPELQAIRAAGQVSDSLLDRLPAEDRAVFKRALVGYQAIDPVTLTQTDRDLPSETAGFAQDADDLKRKFPHLAETTARVLLVDMNNLAGFNLLSHQHADAVLKMQADILRDVMCSNELEDCQHSIYHLGGGKFALLLPNAVQTSQGWQAFTDTQVSSMQLAIHDQVEARINQRTVGEFFADHGLSLEGTGLESRGLTEQSRMGDVPHKVYAEERGVSVTFTERSLTTQERGGAQIEGVRQESEQKIAARRADYPEREPAPAKSAELPDDVEQSVRWQQLVTATREAMNYSLNAPTR